MEDKATVDLQYLGMCVGEGERERNVCLYKNFNAIRVVTQPDETNQKDS